MGSDLIPAAQGIPDPPKPAPSAPEYVSMSADADVRVVQTGQPTAEQMIRINALNAALQIRAQRGDGYWYVPDILDEAEKVADWIALGPQAG